MDFSEHTLHGSGSPSFSSAALGSRKEKKKQAKEDRDRQKQVEKKRRRLEKALATSAAIRLELEKKKQRKKEEEQRLDAEGAALAEAVALHVLLDEDTEGVAHLETYAEIGLQSLSILSGNDQALVDTSNCVSYLSSHAPFNHMLSSGLAYRSSFAYAFINSRNEGSFRSSEFENELTHNSKNCQVALTLGHDNWKAGNGVQELWISADKAKKVDDTIDSSPQSFAVLGILDKTKFKMEADNKILDTLKLQSLD